MNLIDGNNSHSKSKFINGLRNLFVGRISKNMREINGEIIPYEYYTYGHLINACIQDGLALCNDLKVKKIKWYSKRSQKENN